MAGASGVLFSNLCFAFKKEIRGIYKSIYHTCMSMTVEFGNTHIHIDRHKAQITID
jgi:hypothetical protein